jgi:two-component system cell cycle sensor histidine kinase/response regulator CckA
MTAPAVMDEPVPAAAVGHLCGGVAHELNNLLSVILGECDLALMFGAVNPQSRESFDAIRHAGKEAALLTRQLLAYSKRQIVQPAVFDLNELLRVAGGARPGLLEENVALLTRFQPNGAWVNADQSQLELVLRNLVRNAREAMPTGGKLTLETAIEQVEDSGPRSRLGLPSGEYVVLTVADTGLGMTAAVKKHLFEPFFTTKPVGKGTGLGLATCAEIVKQSGGRITVESEADEGTTMRLYLPGVRGEASPLSPGAHASGGGEIILLTDDDDAVRHVAARILRTQGYRVLQAASAAEALRMLTASDMAIDLLLTDVVLPQMGGRELAERARAARPGIRVLFASGYTTDVILQHQLLARDVALITKPFTAESLGRKVRAALDAPATAGANST